MSIVAIDDSSFTQEATPVINYTPNSIDEYIVIVNLPEDWHVVHNYIINENEIDGIPNRKIHCLNTQQFSLRSAIYEMSVSEAEILKTHSKVESVELNPDKYPQPQSPISTSRFGTTVAFPKPQLSMPISGTYAPSTSTTNGVRSNWSQLFVNDPSSEPYQGNGITSTDTVDRDINYTVTGNNVDVVVIDDGMSVLHPEFIATNGSYRVFDVILDGPYKADPAAFSGYTSNVTIDGVNIGSRAQEARARQWWSDTTIRSSAFQSLGTLTIPATYTRIHAHSKNGTDPIIGGHGTACGSQIGGKYHGLAFESNLWIIRIALGGSGGIIAGSTALNACTIFHNAKKAASNNPDPTLINNSWGSFGQTGNTYNTSYTHNYRGSTLSYVGTGVPADGNGTDYTNIIPANVGSCRNYKHATARIPGRPYIFRYNTSVNNGGTYLSSATTTSSAAENAINAGCIVLAAAGNDNQKLSDKNDVDFDNWYLISSIYINRVGGVQQGFSGDHDVGKGTIRIGAVDCAVEPTDERQGVAKYTIRKVSYSNNGPMIDIFAPSEASMAAAYASYESANGAVPRVDDTNYKDRAFNGTSSACPNAAALVAIYLQNNRTATQSSVRTWLTGTACKNNLLSDPYSNANDASYWSQNYLGTYDYPVNDYESFNVRGNGNLRGAPNRVLYNPLITADTTAPTLLSTSPVDGATGVVVNSNIVLNFSESVIAQDNKNIVIYKSDDSVVETIPATADEVGEPVSGSGTAQITIDPTNDFDTSTGYYVLIDSGAFKDSSGNSYAGISDKTTLNFTTEADLTAPTLVSSIPSNGDTNFPIGEDIILNFSEVVTAVSSKNINIHLSNGTLVEQIDVTDSKVSGSGTAQITINPTTTLIPSTGYYILIDSGAFKDGGNNNYAGITNSSTLAFQTAAVGQNELKIQVGGSGLNISGDVTIS